jgi:hypothetical protein
MKINEALAKLEAKNDKDWTENGAPSLTRVQVLMKDSSVTQEQLDEAAGDLKRPDTSIGKKTVKAVEKREPASDDQLAKLLDPETGQFQLMEDYEVKDRETGEVITKQRRK